MTFLIITSHHKHLCTLDLKCSSLIHAVKRLERLDSGRACASTPRASGSSRSTSWPSVCPSPASHVVLTVLKAGEAVCQMVLVPKTKGLSARWALGPHGCCNSLRGLVVHLVVFHGHFFRPSDAVPFVLTRMKDSQKKTISFPKSKIDQNRGQRGVCKIYVTNLKEKFMKFEENRKNFANKSDRNIVEFVHLFIQI